MPKPRLRLRSKILIVIAALILIALLFGSQFQAIIHAWQEYALLHEPMKGKLLRLRVRSAALRRVNKIFIYLPPGYDKSNQRYPVIYMLHGQPGESRDWFLKGRAHETAEHMILFHRIKPVILVSADCFGPGGPMDRTDYLNAIDKDILVETYVSRELPEFIDRTYRTQKRAGSRAILGLSSGGYGAANLGLKHQGMFRVIVCHSGFFEPRFEYPAVHRMLGPVGKLWVENSPLKRVASLHGRKDLHIYVDVGRSDDLLDDNRQFDDELVRHNVLHLYAEVGGGHHWSLWRDRFHVSLPYVAAAFEALANVRPQNPPAVVGIHHGVSGGEQR